jgi:hypothetical protein
VQRLYIFAPQGHIEMYVEMALGLFIWHMVATKIDRYPIIVGIDPSIATPAS